MLCSFYSNAKSWNHYQTSPGSPGRFASADGSRSSQSLSAEERFTLTTVYFLHSHSSVIFAQSPSMIKSSRNGLKELGLQLKREHMAEFAFTCCRTWSAGHVRHELDVNGQEELSNRVSDTACSSLAGF